MTWVRRERDMASVPTSQEKSGANAPAGQVSGPKIVIGVDGSAQSWDAFAWAAGEALRRNGRIVAVFVTSLLEPGEALEAPRSGMWRRRTPGKRWLRSWRSKWPGGPTRSASR